MPVREGEELAVADAKREIVRGLEQPVAPTTEAVAPAGLLQVRDRVLHARAERPIARDLVRLAPRVENTNRVVGVADARRVRDERAEPLELGFIGARCPRHVRDPRDVEGRAVARPDLGVVDVVRLRFRPRAKERWERVEHTASLGHEHDRRPVDLETGPREHDRERGLERSGVGTVAGPGDGEKRERDGEGGQERAAAPDEALGDGPKRGRRGDGGRFERVFHEGDRRGGGTTPAPS